MRIQIKAIIRNSIYLIWKIRPLIDAFSSCILIRDMIIGHRHYIDPAVLSAFIIPVKRFHILPSRCFERQKDNFLFTDDFALHRSFDGRGKLHTRIQVNFRCHSFLSVFRAGRIQISRCSSQHFPQQIQTVAVGFQHRNNHNGCLRKIHLDKIPELYSRILCLCKNPDDLFILRHLYGHKYLAVCIHKRTQKIISQCRSIMLSVTDQISLSKFIEIRRKRIGFTAIFHFLFHVTGIYFISAVMISAAVSFRSQFRLCTGIFLYILLRLIGNRYFH